MRLLGIELPDPADAWSTAGFSVVDDTVRLDNLSIALRPTATAEVPTLVVDHRSVDSATPPSLDGVAYRTAHADDLLDPDDRSVVPHPNGVTRLDHVVVLAPDLTRMLAALDTHGIEIRRERSTQVMGAPATQLFAWAGDTILEIVAPADSGDGPSTIWGLAFEAPDLGVTERALGDLAGQRRSAVQPGREILTVRHRTIGISLTVAVMSPHRGPGAPAASDS